MKRGMRKKRREIGAGRVMEGRIGRVFPHLLSSSLLLFSYPSLLA